MSPQAIIRDWVVPLAWICVLALGASEFVGAPWVILGRSMTPGLAPGDRVVVDRWTYRHRIPRIGEVALLRAPDGTPMVKRIGAIEPAGIWVEGDNPAISRDSRRFGFVSAGEFSGRVVWRYWPPARFGRVR